MEPILDAYLDAPRRAAATEPVAVALSDWSAWPEARRIAWAQAVALRTIREVLPDALRAAGLPRQAAVCAAAVTMDEYCVAANWAVAAAGKTAKGDATILAPLWVAATLAAGAHAEAARVASRLAGAAWTGENAALRDEARHRVLDLACRIWRECAAATVQS